MPSAWDILGLDEPTDDIRVIKKAYAAKLRVTRPDDNSADFMQLREAYEHARFSAIYSHEALQTDAPSPIEFNQNPQTLSVVQTQKNTRSSRKPKHHAFLFHRAKALVSDENLRNDRSAWDDILDDPELEHIDTFLDFEASIRHHFLDVFGYFSGNDNDSNLEQKPRTIGSDIGLLLFRKLGWHDVFTRPYEIQSEIWWLRQDLGVQQRLGGPTVYPEGYFKRRATVNTGSGGDAYLLLIPIVVFLLAMSWVIDNAT